MAKFELGKIQEPLNGKKLPDTGSNLNIKTVLSDVEKFHQDIAILLNEEPDLESKLALLTSEVFVYYVDPIKKEVREKYKFFERSLALKVFEKLKDEKAEEERFHSFLCTLQDIGNQKELGMQIQIYLQTQKKSEFVENNEINDKIGKFIHDLNNKLGAIPGNIGLMHDDFKNSDIGAIYKSLNAIKVACLKSNELIEDNNLFLDQQELEPIIRDKYLAPISEILLDLSEMCAFYMKNFSLSEDSILKMERKYNQILERVKKLKPKQKNEHG